MMAKTHLLIGVTGGLIVNNILEQPIEPFFICGLIIGSITPDIDHPKGFINQKFSWVYNGYTKAFFYILLALGCLTGYYYLNQQSLLLPIPFLIMVAISHHRGITHSLLGLSVMYMTTRYLMPVLSLQSCYDGFVIGWALHIIADMFNPQGVELFYPCRKNFRLPITIDTDEPEERVVQMITCSIITYMGFMAIK